MDMRDEVPLEDHRFFWARLEHLERRHPVALLTYMEKRKLTQHLRETTTRAMQALSELVINRHMPLDRAEELVMHQIVADPMERSRLPDSCSRKKMRYLLTRYKAAIPNFTRTYLSQNETTE